MFENQFGAKTTWDFEKRSSKTETLQMNNTFNAPLTFSKFSMAANNGDPTEISNRNLSSCNFSIGERFESEIPDSSYSLSLPSEPPDLRNWFSSYAYESPELNTGDGFSPGESQSKGFSLEEILRIKKEDLGQFKISSVRDFSIVDGRNSLNELVGCQRFLDEDNQEKENQGFDKENHLVDSKENPICRNGCSDESLEGKQEQSHDFIPLKDDEKSYLNCRNALPEPDAIEDDDALERRIATTQVDRTSPASGASSITKSIRSSDDKENEGKVFSIDGGFISTRKNRIIRETDGIFSGRNRVIEENSRNESMISNGEKVGVVRNALSERTNIQWEPVAEIAGKWRYPRRNKPDLGPPLKQLRLEQWVHRV
ncbi:uncharacterized protein LOC122081235 [Macadamia integrifolia]|uniref:uncharacterized protein LOC122081235 n=1 Tax=Macadamia integrifolia TaxID=60698 RepID=UPI001C4F8E68|nr:uncharacterized protein LOC122081235 [Macadamia integrifolia]